MLSNDTLNKIEQDAKQATPGPWELFTHFVPHHKGGSHMQHVIRTGWEQGQLKAKMEIITTAVGLGKTPDEPAHLLWMMIEDGAHIANCDPQTVLELVKMARRYVSVRRLTPRRFCELFEAALTGQQFDELIDQAIAGEKDADH